MMKIQTGLLLSALLILTGFSTAFAAQDYNSSRSNTTSAVDVNEETDLLLQLAVEDAAGIMRNMSLLDQRNGYKGKYRINVEVRVSLERETPSAESRPARP